VPVHLTEFVIGRGRPSKSGPLDGAGRRSIYTSVRRNFLPTLMLTFDTPIPFSTVGRRNVTNVPGQSLALTNDRFIFEQAGVWARRVIESTPGAAAEDRLRSLIASAFGRPAADAELAAFVDMRSELAQLYGVDDDDVRVWIDLCHTLLGANEFIWIR